MKDPFHRGDSHHRALLLRGPSLLLPLPPPPPANPPRTDKTHSIRGKRAGGGDKREEFNHTAVPLSISKTGVGLVGAVSGVSHRVDARCNRKLSSIRRQAVTCAHEIHEAVTLISGVTRTLNGRNVGCNVCAVGCTQPRPPAVGYSVAPPAGLMYSESSQTSWQSG